MFDVGIEKRSSLCDSLQEPDNTHIAHGNTFLPTYEETLNDNLRNFGEPERHANLEAFDLIAEPKRGRRDCLKREYLIIAIIFFSLCAIALPLGLVYILRNAGSEQETATMQTRRAESSFSIAPVTAAILPTAIIPMTVYVTVTPTLEESIPIVTITVTASSPDVEPTTAGPQPTDTLTSLSISTDTALVSTAASLTSSQSTSWSLELSTSPVPTSISSVTIEPNLEASIQPELSQTSALYSPTDPTTTISPTTMEPSSTVSKVLQTAKGRFGFCGVSGSNCKRLLSGEKGTGTVKFGRE
ncbi:uncharacterized protein SEPMUDRAFT_153190 [Sphaerulina musiva SO2202]|uniref:Uncharacterized protein n=1 Tax=Sphaerulina musiva (strain SO2202) TaxID=692275 RepID=N1QMH8_SPHMS|nr:uncharacterized protein SEPMUDRAFT_153190 [Sphaerulina musiva SO2202]EMF17148.1 hypothetical protein SEPMUDRAFT_153190 [Sphaerulina musiva SO2202]